MTGCSERSSRVATQLYLIPPAVGLESTVQIPFKCLEKSYCRKVINTNYIYFHLHMTHHN